MSTIALKTLAEREFAVTDNSYFPMWPWIVESCAEEFECSPDAVSLVETEEGEIICIDGEPQARLIYRW